MSENQTIDNYRLKVFLYKYTPIFSKTGTTAPSGTSFQSVDRYSIELNESKYFSKYDITDYVASYSFSQDLYENTYSWSLILQNSFVSFNEINTNILVEGPRLGSEIRTKSGKETSLANLAQYEASAHDIANSTTNIANAKLNRGKIPDTMSVQAGTVNTDPIFKSLSQSKSGLKLQDLIQEYDMISVFLYRGTVPVTDLMGTRVKDPTTGHITFTIDDGGSYTLTSGDLRIESLLLSADPKDATKTLFNNEFNGFILAKTVTSEVGAPETINITGNGISRLFGATRRIIKQGLLQSSLYDIALSDKPEEYSAFSTNYANKTMLRIFVEFFRSLYSIQIGVNTTFDTTNPSAVQTYDEAIPNSSFYDISSLMVGNTLTTNLFTIPPFLLALVMKRHGFAYRAPKDTDSFTTLTNKVTDSLQHPKVLASQFTIDPQTNQISASQVIKTGGTTVVDQSTVNALVDVNESLQVSQGTRHPVSYSNQLNQLRGYFLFFAEVFKGYAPELKTPFEIMDEIKEKSFIEVFEQPSGEFIIRDPQYNDTTNTIFSSTVDVINRSYTETANNLVTIQKVSYILDVVKELFPGAFFSFMDGKLFLQYGFIESMADSNPNALNSKTPITSVADKRISGLVRYSQYLLNLHNASLKTGTLVVGYDSRLKVGQTFFDEKYSKFAYITGVSKSINVGGTVTITLNLSYVRDAYVDSSKTLQVEHLDTLTELAQQFQTATIQTVTTVDTGVNA